MCQRVQCQQCRKPTYAGCGKHVEQVLRGLGEAERCQCRLVTANAIHHTVVKAATQQIASPGAV